MSTREVAAAAIGPLFLAYALRGLLAGATVFATWTNLCWVGVSLTMRGHGRRSVQIASGGGVVFLLMGSASFAFHAAQVVGSPAWALDIALGWVVLMYMSSLLAFVALRVLGAPLGAARLAAHALLAAAVTAAWACFEWAHRHQLLMMSAGGGAVAALFAFVEIRRGWRQGGAAAALRAAADVAVLAWLLVAATIVQCDMLGAGCPGARRYDLSHGQWHFLTSVSLGAVHRRAIERVAEADGAPVVAAPAQASRLADAALSVYALGAVAVKEGAAGAGDVRLPIALGCALLAAPLLCEARLLLRRTSCAVH